MKLGVVGSREFNDYQHLKDTLDALGKVHDVAKIVSGGARGADCLAARYAKERNIPITVFPAEWGRYGNSAGYLRNMLIVDESDMIIAFWDGKSRGTGHTIRLAQNAKKRVLISTLEGFSWPMPLPL